MNHTIADNYNYIYHQMLFDINHDPDFTGGSYMGGKKFDSGYKEKLNMSFELTDPRDNEIKSNVRKVDYEYAKCFYDFILSGEPYLPEDFLKKYPHAKRFLDSGELPSNFSAAYGPKIKRQLPRIVKLLKEKPDTRWAVINILLEEDKIIWDHKTTMEYPCCSTLHFLIRDNELNLIASMRSNNMAITVAYDVFLYTSALITVSNLLEIDIGVYHHHINSAHIFGKDQDRTNNILKEYYG